MDAENSVVTEPEERVLMIERVFDAPRALVFKAWTEPERMVRWFGPQGFTTTVLKADFRPGGDYRFHMRSPEGADHWLQGVYREVVEPEAADLHVLLGGRERQSHRSGNAVDGHPR